MVKEVAVDIGMLWFDNDMQLVIFSKVQKAAAYYRNKYGEEPNLCFVHPSMISDEKADAGSVEVWSNATVLPHHFWIGVHQSDAAHL